MMISLWDMVIFHIPLISRWFPHYRCHYVIHSYDPMSISMNVFQAPGGTLRRTQEVIWAARWTPRCTSAMRRKRSCGRGIPMCSFKRRDGYGSIPINTIFSGMNIHLPAILMFTRGTRVLTHPQMGWGMLNGEMVPWSVSMMGHWDDETYPEKSACFLLLFCYAFSRKIFGW